MIPLAAERHDPVLDAVRFFSMLYAEQTGILELRTVPLEPTPERRLTAWRLRDFVPVVQGKFARGDFPEPPHSRETRHTPARSLV